MNDKHERALQLDQAAARTASLAEAQALAGEADRLRGDAQPRPVRRTLFPVFRN